MLPIQVEALKASATAKLKEYQDAIDALGDYADRVAAAKSSFRNKNRADNSAFADVREKLTQMCRGPRRCMYCEDSVADEVEHFKPKDLYPEVVFAWTNYLYACGSCNGPKNNKFSIIDGTGALKNVTRPRARRGEVQVISPPAAGDIALIDPRTEDPMKFLMLDLRDTFEFTSIADPSTVEEKRANYTLEVLRLNERDFLIEGRSSAFGSFYARLFQYVEEKSRGASVAELALNLDGIRRSPHPTVWAEMVRQQHAHSRLNQLFNQAPELLGAV